MKRKKRKIPTVNSTSAADFAFMILLFFLLTTSMDVDQGMARRLPPPPNPNQQTEMRIRERNILKVFINTQNQILCGGEYVELRGLKDKVKAFIVNESNNDHMPEKIEKDIPYFGKMMVTENHVISLQNDRGTQYQAYIDVQNELMAAYTELRDEISRRQWGRRFADLNEDQQGAVTDIFPQKISEAEPKSYGDRR